MLQRYFPKDPYSVGIKRDLFPLGSEANRLAQTSYDAVQGVQFRGASVDYGQRPSVGESIQSSGLQSCDVGSS